MPPNLLDQVERRLLQMGGESRERGKDSARAPVTHHFTPGLYVREIFLQAGLFLTTEIHLTEHPFVVAQGSCYVYCEDDEGARWMLISAPHVGITKPGTRRFLMIESDTVWLTFHPTDLTDVAEIEEKILAPRRELA